jgi:hypothetical protein
MSLRVAHTLSCDVCDMRELRDAEVQSFSASVTPTFITTHADLRAELGFRIKPFLQ